jgi:hypothetical protein
MRRNGIVSLLAVSMLLVGASSASAQFMFGPRVAYGTDFDFMIGGAATYGFNTVLFEGAGPLTGSLAFDYALDCPFDGAADVLDDASCSFWEIAPTVFVPFNSPSGLYAGAGLDIARFSSDVDTVIGDFGASSTDIGLALQGGYMFALGGQTAMADARFSLGGSEQLVLAFAFLFGGSN